jgi:hypothetical protein
MERHRDPKHSRRTTAQTREESYTKSLSAHPSDEEEDFVQETPEAALVAAQAYLLTTQPKPGDPREHMHQAAIRSLELIEDKLMGNLLEKKATHHKERRKEKFKRQSSRNETSESSGDEKHQKRKEDARNIIAQARVNNSRYAWREENYEDDDKEMGALCFTRRVRKMRVPKQATTFSSYCNMNIMIRSCCNRNFLVISTMALSNGMISLSIEVMLHDRETSIIS